MFRSRSIQVLVVCTFCSSLAATNSLVRGVHAQNSSPVDLEGDTHSNPPASTTDKSTPAPAATTQSDGKAAKATAPDRDSARQEADAKKLKLRAGERVGATASGKAQVFGMSLQEGTHARVKVVEVAMNSPAFDAGVMKGDEIVAFQGFRGETYREWIDGIRRLATDTGAGLKIPVVVARNDKQLTVLIEVQAKPVLRPTGRALAQPGSPLIAPPTPGSEPGTVVGGNGGNNVVVNGGAAIGQSFGGGETASPNERAVAQIVRIGGQPSPAPSAANAGAAGAAANEPPSPQNLAAGATATPTNGGARIGMAGFRDDPAGMVVMVDVAALSPGTYSVGISDPSVAGGATVSGTGTVNPNVQAPSQAAPTTQAPATTSRSGEVAAPDKTADATRGTNDTQPTQTTKNTTAAGQSVGASGTLNQIGTITVDQSGTGRLQQKVESAQVRSVVGQAIVLYSQNVAQNGSAGAAATPGADSQPAVAGSKVPVAAGIIQLITDRRPPANTEPQTQAPAATNGAAQQPASAATPAGQNLVR